MGKTIVIFCSHYLPYLGGVETYTSHLAQELKKRGDRVVIVTSNDMQRKTYERMEGIPVFRMSCWNVLDGRFPVSKPDGRFLKIHRKLLEIPVDLVIIQTRFYIHSLYGAWMAKRWNARCIAIDHSTSHMTIGSAFWDRLGAVYDHGMTWLLKRCCRQFYGVSKDCCQWLRHFHIKPAGILYNAVDPEEIRRMTEHPVRDFRKEYEIEPDDMVITYTGRLVKEKGIENLLEAFQKLPGRRQAILMVAGDGEELEKLRRKEEPRMILLGRLPLEEVAALLAQSDIYCLPTDYPEGFPTSVLEAAAAGCFVITTTRGGSKELIIDDSYGIIMKDNHPETIREALRKAMDDPTGRKAAALRARERLCRYFTWEQTADRLNRIKNERL